MMYLIGSIFSDCVSMVWLVMMLGSFFLVMWFGKLVSCVNY